VAISFDFLRGRNILDAQNISDVRRIPNDSPNTSTSRRTLSPPPFIDQQAVPLANFNKAARRRKKAFQQAVLRIAMTRSSSKKKQFRANAQKLIEDQDCALDDEETTGDGTCPVQVGPTVSGAVVDKTSMKGSVVVTGGGVQPQVIKTGSGETGSQVIHIGDGQTCVIYGYSTLLYFKPQQ